MHNLLARDMISIPLRSSYTSWLRYSLLYSKLLRLMSHRMMQINNLRCQLYLPADKNGAKGKIQSNPLFLR